MRQAEERSVGISSGGLLSGLFEGRELDGGGDSVVVRKDRRPLVFFGESEGRCLCCCDQWLRWHCGCVWESTWTKDGRALGQERERLGVLDHGVGVCGNGCCGCCCCCGGWRKTLWILEICGLLVLQVFLLPASEGGLHMTRGGRGRRKRGKCGEGGVWM